MHNKALYYENCSNYVRIYPLLATMKGILIKLYNVICKKWNVVSFCLNDLWMTFVGYFAGWCNIFLNINQFKHRKSTRWHDHPFITVYASMNFLMYWAKILEKYYPYFGILYAIVRTKFYPILALLFLMYLHKHSICFWKSKQWKNEKFCLSYATCNFLYFLLQWMSKRLFFKFFKTSRGCL